MKHKKLIATLCCATLALGILAGCGADKKEAGKDAAAGSSADKVITIGATPVPHEEVLNAVKEEVAKEGYTLKIVPFTDYVQPNNALISKDLDANYFQHKPYLDDFNAKNKTDIVSAFTVHFEPMAIFAGKTKSLDALKDGAKISVPNDPTNEARALLLLQDNGLIKLKENAGIAATKNDIVENPHNFDIVEMDAAQLPRTLTDVDLAVINCNYALGANLSLDDAVAKEGKDSLAFETYANIVAVRKGEENSEKTQVLKKALTSEAAKKFILEKYKGAVEPTF